MKQQGKCIVGDNRAVEDFTSDWMSVKVHPSTFYGHRDDIYETLDKVKGLYAELDLGQYVLLRFSEKDDVTAFHRNHHHYI